uniref:16S rRNA (guanine(527)-N(7))-methyltransferase RsmG n=1 Tax=Vreelandella maris TaxID=2729617 RepID=UPI0030ED3B85
MSSLNTLLKTLPASVAPRLDQGLSQLAISVDDHQREQLLGLLALLHKWNRAYNLTAVRDVDDMVSRHVLDSAVVLPYVQGPRLLDVGAGPGLPGIVLAILAPELDVTLLDSNGKKVRF